MTGREQARRSIFGPADVFTVRPTTYAEIDPVVEAASEWKCGWCGGDNQTCDCYSSLGDGDE
jgi:hypothetical protein